MVEVDRLLGPARWRRAAGQLLRGARRGGVPLADGLGVGDLRMTAASRVIERLRERGLLRLAHDDARGVIIVPGPLASTTREEN